MKAVRWILVIPAVLLVYWLSYVLCSLFSMLVNYVNYGMLSRLGIKVFASVIAGVAGVSAAISIAPNYKKAAAIIGAVVLFIPTLLSLWLILNGQDYSGGNWVVYVEGIASTAASIWTCVKYWQDETL